TKAFEDLRGQFFRLHPSTRIREIQDLLTSHEPLELSVGILPVVNSLIESQLPNDYAALSINPHRRWCDFVTKSIPDDKDLPPIHNCDLRVCCPEVNSEINRVSCHRRYHLPFRQSPEPSCGAYHRRKWLGLLSPAQPC